jgi:hypothetical protein
MTETQLPFRKVVAVFYELPLIATSDPRKKPTRTGQAVPVRLVHRFGAEFSGADRVVLFAKLQQRMNTTKVRVPLATKVSITMFSFLSRLS